MEDNCSMHRNAVVFHLEFVVVAVLELEVVVQELHCWWPGLSSCCDTPCSNDHTQVIDDIDSFTFFCHLSFHCRLTFLLTFLSPYPCLCLCCHDLCRVLVHGQKIHSYQNSSNSCPWTCPYCFCLYTFPFSFAIRSTSIGAGPLLLLVSAMGFSDLRTASVVHYLDA